MNKELFDMLLTGMNWASPFLEELGGQSDRIDFGSDKLAECSFTLNNHHKVVVAKHPQGKPHVSGSTR